MRRPKREYLARFQSEENRKPNRSEQASLVLYLGSFGTNVELTCPTKEEHIFKATTEEGKIPPHLELKGNDYKWDVRLCG